jgi:hypothetical protein
MKKERLCGHHNSDATLSVQESKISTVDVEIERSFHHKKSDDRVSRGIKQESRTVSVVSLASIPIGPIKKPSHTGFAMNTNVGNRTDSSPLRTYKVANQFMPSHHIISK